MIKDFDCYNCILLYNCCFTIKYIESQIWKFRQSLKRLIRIGILYGYNLIINNKIIGLLIRGSRIVTYNILNKLFILNYEFA